MTAGVDLHKRFESWLTATYGDGPSLVVASNGAIRSTTIHGWVKGRAKPGADALRVLHQLGCNITWLVTGEGPMYSDSAAGRRWAVKNGAKGGMVREAARGASQEIPRLISEIERVLEKYRVSKGE